MDKILVNEKEFTLTSFKNEDELEKIVVKNYSRIFGENSYYFDLKKGLKHKKGDLLTIPDGYLIRFSKEPSLTIVENEMSTHDVVKHIGWQFVKFNSAITDPSKYHLKKSLTEYLEEHPKEEKKVKNLLPLTLCKNISDLLDVVVMEEDIEFAIVIDETTDELERVVNPFHPEIIVLKKFQNNNEIIYHVNSETDAQEFHDSSDRNKKTPMRRLPEMDTIVCPAREEGFNDVFLKEHRWFWIRIHPKRIPKIDYIAMYEVKPISAIRYVGEVKDIKEHKKDKGYYEVILTGPPTKIKPIKLTEENPNLAVQAPRYTIKKLIDQASKLEDIFIL